MKASTFAKNTDNNNDEIYYEKRNENLSTKLKMIVGKVSLPKSFNDNEEKESYLENKYLKN